MSLRKSNLIPEIKLHVDIDSDSGKKYYLTIVDGNIIIVDERDTDAQGGANRNNTEGFLGISTRINMIVDFK